MKSANLNPYLLYKTVEKIPTRNGYGDALIELGKTNKEVVVLTADLAESTRALGFGEKYPDRYIECGVAEQNMMGVAAGLALAGKIPFVSSYAVFSPGRSWDQLRVSVCYSKANVKIAGAHTGVSVGPDGATHQALEDMAIVRAIPDIIVCAPCDYEETRKCTIAAAKHKGPVYFRFAREKTPVITTNKTPFKLGQAYVCREGYDVSLIACGPLLHEALLAAEALAKEHIEAEVINSHTIKPLDKKTIISSLKKTACAVTVEEHQIIGGLHGAVAELCAKKLPTPIETIGMPDSFGESGEPDELLAKYGMKAKDIIKAVKKVIKRK
ncbi:MAG: transketolase family protein [Patescibacteria group bacterium]